MSNTPDPAAVPADEAAATESPDNKARAEDRHRRPPEIGGPKGPEPTRYGDWERNGRCSDF